MERGLSGLVAADVLRNRLGNSPVGEIGDPGDVRGCNDVLREEGMCRVDRLLPEDVEPRAGEMSRAKRAVEGRPGREDHPVRR